MQGLSQSHPVCASTDHTEHKCGKPIHTGSTTKMSSSSFSCAAWITGIKQSEASTTCVVFILWAGVRIVPADTSLETKQNPVPCTSHHPWITAHSKWAGASLTAIQLSYKNKSPEKTSEEEPKRQGTNISLFLAKDIFFLLAEKTPSCIYYQRQAGTTFLKHTEIHITVSVHLPLKQGCSAFWWGLIYFGRLYDTKMSNRIQSLSPAGQCARFQPSLCSSMSQRQPEPRRHRGMLRAPAGTGAPGPGSSRPPLTESRSCCTQTQVKHSALVSFLPVTLIKENAGAAPFVARNCGDRRTMSRQARALNRSCSPQEPAPAHSPWHMDGMNSHRGNAVVLQ